MEKWLPVVGFEGRYEVNNYCQIKSLERDIFYEDGRIYHQKEKILTPQKWGSKCRYDKVILFKDNIRYPVSTHVVGAKAFLPNPDNLPYINHKDENPENNYIHINEDGTVDPEKSSLEWCTPKYNVNYGTCTKRRSETLTNGVRSMPVLQYTMDGVFLHRYCSASEAERQTGIQQGNISACCNGKRVCAGTRDGGKYKWKYENGDR